MTSVDDHNMTCIYAVGSVVVNWAKPWVQQLTSHYDMLLQYMRMVTPVKLGGHFFILRRKNCLGHVYGISAGIGSKITDIQLHVSTFVRYSLEYILRSFFNSASTS